MIILVKQGKPVAGRLQDDRKTTVCIGSLRLFFAPNLCQDFKAGLAIFLLRDMDRPERHKAADAGDRKQQNECRY